jgi:3-keto-5-aminohexanoate cleavage enzyme
MEPLIITATPNICWLAPNDIPYPRTIEDIMTEAMLCEQAGAGIFHIHAEGRWAEVIRSVHQQTALVIQCGMSSLPIHERMDVWTKHADMISMIVSHHDEAFAGLDVHVLHPREELEEYMYLCNQNRVKPELEVWHAGSIWNMRYLIDKGLLLAPYFTTLFFGWPGGSWSPPTMEEYLYRRRLMPSGSVINVSIMGSEQKTILTAAILHGDHVRVGTEDYPYLDGKVAATHELVADVVTLARQLGRKIATVEEARNILGIGAYVP